MGRVLRTAGGVIAGYALMVLVITRVRETWPGGVGWRGSSLPVLATAGLLTCAAGAGGAALATRIARDAGRLPALVMAALVVVETSALLRTGGLSGPLWFDLLAAASLVGAILLGGELALRRGSARPPRTRSTCTPGWSPVKRGDRRP